MRHRVLAELRLAEVSKAELTRLEAEQERAAEREARRIERNRRNAPKHRAALEAFFAADHSPDETETPCNDGKPMEDPKTGA